MEIDGFPALEESARGVLRGITFAHQQERHKGEDTVGLAELPRMQKEKQ